MFHHDTLKTFIIVIFAKNASFRSYGIICLPRMPLLSPEIRIPTESTQRGHNITIRDFSQKCFVQKLRRGTFAYLLRSHIRNINMRRYVTSARGHELNGRVRAHAYNNYYACAECVWAAK